MSCFMLINQRQKQRIIIPNEMQEPMQKIRQTEKIHSDYTENRMEWMSSSAAHSSEMEKMTNDEK